MGRCRKGNFRSLSRKFKFLVGKKWGSSLAQVSVHAAKHTSLQPYQSALTSTTSVLRWIDQLHHSSSKSAALGGANIMPTSHPPHKAKKKKNGDSPSTTSSNELATSDKKAGAQSPAFPLVAFFWPARKNTSQWVILPLILMIVGLFRWCAGLWGYSGIEPSSIATFWLTSARLPGSANAW